MIEKFKNSISPELSAILKSVSPMLAKEQGRKTVFPRDVIVSFFQEDIPVIKKTIEKYHIDRDSILDELLGLQVASNKQRMSKKGGIDNSVIFILQGADRIVSQLEHPCINIEHVVYSFLIYQGKSKPTNQIKSVLNKFGIYESSFKKIIIDDKKDSYDILDNIFKNFVEEETGIKKTSNIRKTKYKGISVEEFDEKISVLCNNLIKSGFIENLNDSVIKSKEKFIGREDELERCIRILLRKKKRNVIIIGESGTGKTSLVEGLATMIVSGNVPEKFKNTDIFSVNLGNIISGTKYRGQFEERMKNVIYFMEKANTLDKNIIMFIDEIHTICKTGSAEGAIDASSMLKPLLAKGEIQCIGTSTLEDYRKNIIKDSALMRRFSTIFLEEPSAEETKFILKSVKKEYERFHDVKIDDYIIDDIVYLSETYIKNRNFPDKAFDVLDEACTNLSSKGISGELTSDIIYNIISDMTSIPVTTVCGKEKEILSNLENKLSDCVIGQKEAIFTLSNAIKRSRIGLKDPNKPIGTFLFLGPTGTGKTLLTKTLSETLFGKDKIIRLDMSEYMDKMSVSKITGSSPGYVGYDDGSRFAEEVRKRPYSVILLDEIEKAHKEVLNVFLQIFDEGRMTDSVGRLVDFRNTIIIMTSNLATAELGKQSIGFDSKTNDKDTKKSQKFLMEKVKGYFNPEFINRLDEVIIFNNIKEEDVENIFNIEIKKSIDRISKMDIDLEISNKAKRFICKEGYSEKYGARPMARTIQKYIETPFSCKILSDEIKPGDIVYLDTEDDETISFSNKKRKED
jgi:ATP-dependent Clp protease ATP-binding subunit ClpC